jgi:hypothetical protein
MRIARDINGKAYARISEIKEGDYVIVDGGFTCMKDGTRKRVRLGRNGELNIACTSDGGHSLNGQYETKCAGKCCQPFYMGIYPTHS